MRQSFIEDINFVQRSLEFLPESNFYAQAENAEIKRETFLMTVLCTNVHYICQKQAKVAVLFRNIIDTSFCISSTSAHTRAYLPHTCLTLAKQRSLARLSICLNLWGLKFRSFYWRTSTIWFNDCSITYRAVFLQYLSLRPVFHNLRTCFEKSAENF